MDKLPVRNKYVKIRDEFGEEAAKEWMRSVRKKVDPKNIKGRPAKEKTLTQQEKKEVGLDGENAQS